MQGGGDGRDGREAFERSLLSLVNYLQRADTTWEPQLAI